MLAWCGGALQWRERQAFFEPQVLSRFPVEDAVVLNLISLPCATPDCFRDEDRRSSPNIDNSLIVQVSIIDKDLDLGYRVFLKEREFLHRAGTFRLAKLRRHVISEGGSCYEDLCRMQAGMAGRRISFLPLRQDTMALAVAADDLAAARLKKPGTRVTAQIPPAPVWLSVPGSALRVQGALPPGIRLLLF